MSHFTVLAVISPDKYQPKIEEFKEKYMDTLVSVEDETPLEDFEEDEFLQSLVEASRQPNTSAEGLMEYIAVNEVIEEYLAPYQENNMGDCPEEYLAFNVIPEEDVYDAEVTEDSGIADGHPELVGLTFTEAFEKRWEDDRPESFVEELLERGYPEDRLDEVDGLALAAVIGDGYRVNVNEDGDIEYGYWHNPESKWDWYQLGGRWTGSLQKKEGTPGYKGSPGLFSSPSEDENAVDLVKVRHLDTDHFEQQTRNRIDEFWEEYQNYLKSGEEPGDHPFRGVHSKLMDMGIEWTNEEEFREAVEHNRDIQNAARDLKYIRMSDADYEAMSLWGQRDRDQAVSRMESADEPNEEYLAALEKRAEVPEVDLPRKTYGTELTYDQLQSEYRWLFEWGTYAAVDEDGWHAKGEMGWWGMSSDDADDKREWGKGFFDRFVKSRDPDTFLAVIDCHV